MTITVKYLASIADELGKNEETLPPQQHMTVESVWEFLNPDKPMKPNTLCAINFNYASLTDAVDDGVELAFFPPVTGG
ncbi:MoaD/ThiS family protein [Ostreibacterium oceani]|uniref:Molybdopterin synthase sulfur carrier subunit n=1 Tax=Ostreibacterium oceani TaxID=2654998 RepID=A0A6N7EWA8_9GAMM|nr:MoaD/ThiS family protein [Ostreibacterium oceani]MPV85387.1 molybdopterin synthase sulfur carrier subunit [Ostreibacterium oceani]